MNSKERILSAIKLREPDRVPVSIVVLNTWFDRADESIAIDIIERCDPIVSIYLESEYGTEYNMIFGKKVKEFSKIVREKNKTRVTIHTPKGELTQTVEHKKESDWITEPLFNSIDDIYKFYSFPYEPYDKSICLDEYMYWNNIIKDQGLIVFEIYNACCMLYEFLGPERFYISLMDNPDLVKDFISTAEERLEEYVKNIVMNISIDKPVVFRIVGQEILGKPWGSEKFFDEFIVPFDGKLIKLIHEKGGLAYEHMHGKVRDVLDRKIKIGADAMGPFEVPPAGDITLKEAKEKLFGKVCIYGNLDDMQVLSNKDKRDIRIRALKAIREAASGGGYILGGTESSIYNLETAKNFILMSGISEIYGNYPINLKKIENKIKSLEMY